MFGRLRKKFKKWKQKRLLRQLILHEILEMLCTICLYIESDGRHHGNPYARKFSGHFDMLKKLARAVRNEDNLNDVAKDDFETHYLGRWI